MLLKIVPAQRDETLKLGVAAVAGVDTMVGLVGRQIGQRREVATASPTGETVAPDVELFVELV